MSVVATIRNREPACFEAVKLLNTAKDQKGTSKGLLLGLASGLGLWLVLGLLIIRVNLIYTAFQFLCGLLSGPLRCLVRLLKQWLLNMELLPAHKKIVSTL